MVWCLPGATHWPSGLRLTKAMTPVAIQEEKKDGKRWSIGWENR